MRVDRVVERLNGEFAWTVKLETICWEREFYKAHATFQAQIPEAAACDIVTAILKHRLGTELPDDFPAMLDGGRYPSGTAYEILSAIDAEKTKGLPDVYVFRNPDPPTVQLDDHATNVLVAALIVRREGLRRAHPPHPSMKTRAVQLKMTHNVASAPLRQISIGRLAPSASS